ncbi:MAG: hypothetical protein EOP86_09295 [Verrucomicrobiaceae bacterium]|nr:MAG: hypothetical protein EOP86_09295 [Verrucomicrobiaceae bacterium]
MSTPVSSASAMSAMSAMSALPAFRHYCICQDAEGGTLELWRGADEVACLAFDTKRSLLVELHVAIGPAEQQRDLQGFQHLLQLAGPLHHRHLLGVIEGGEDEGANYYITDFLDGERLDTWLKRVVPLPPWLALTVLMQLVEGLAALASHPRLLAGVEVLHSGITLTGDRVDDLLVKVCDLGLSGAKPVSTEPRFVEARIIHDTARLLLYMLTGTLPEGAMTGDTLPEGPDMAEVRFLLDTLTQASAPHHPRTLEQMRNLVERCRHDLPAGTAAHPEKLPAALRPRLPLIPWLPGGAEVAEAAGEDCALDIRPGDAAQPYRHRGTERATRHAVMAQVLPPPGIVPAEFFAPLLNQAWAAGSAGGAPHLLRLRVWDAAAAVPVAVEELPGKWTLDDIVRLRQRLEPAEVLMLLRQLDDAAESAALLDLPLYWRSPRLVPLEFTAPDAGPALAAPDKLARLPLGEWPAFRLKVRTWPLMLNFTQPERFQLERLLPKDTGLPAMEAVPGRAGQVPPPSARDFALLAVWMMGGTAHLRENVKPLLYETLHAKPSAAESRREFLERFRQRVEVSAAPASIPHSAALTSAPAAAPEPGAAPVPEDPAATDVDIKTQDHGNAGRTPPRPVPPVRPQPPAGVNPSGRAGGGRGRRNADRRAAAAAAPMPGALAEAGLGTMADSRGTPAPETPPGQDQGGFLNRSPVAEEAGEGPALGFAEALFGGRNPLSSDSRAGGPGTDSPAHPLFGGAVPEDHPDFATEAHPAGDPGVPEGAPLGFMEAARRHSPFMQDHNVLGGTHLPRRRSPWMLVLVVILISAAIAALMAELSGKAIWHR